MRALIVALLLTAACGDTTSITIVDLPDASGQQVADAHVEPLDAGVDAPLDATPTPACGEFASKPSVSCWVLGRCDGKSCTTNGQDSWLYTCTNTGDAVDPQTRPDIPGCIERDAGTWCCPPACVAHDDANCRNMFPDKPRAFICAAQPGDGGVSAVVDPSCERMGPFARDNDSITYCCP